MAESVLKTWLVEPLQGLAAFGFYGLFGALPLDVASGLGGGIARLIGPRLATSRRARANLRRSFPDLDDPAIDRILADVWENLGRVVGEFPHLPRMDFTGADPRIEVVGAEHVADLVQDGRAGMVVGGHLGNWEIGPFCAAALGLPTSLVYRSANNRFVERLFRHVRKGVGGDMIAKGALGARRMLEILKAGGHVGILVDQKMNDGIAVPFLGRDAMTAPALAQLALKFDLPVIMGRVVRLKGARFRVEFYSPMRAERSGDRAADIAAFMTRVNAILGVWVRDNPGQWLWLHRRWPD